MRHKCRARHECRTIHFGGGGGGFVFNSYMAREGKRSLLNVSCELLAGIRVQKLLLT